MVLLNCVIVDKGCVITIDIDEGRTVALLKDAIKEKKPNTIKVNAGELLLFLAKKGGVWLDGADVVGVLLDHRGHPNGFKQMNNPLLRLKNAKCFGESFTPKEGSVHVLVVIPEDAESQTCVLGRRSLPMSDAQQIQPSPKRPKFQKYVAFTEPVGEMDFSVPLDTISAFHQIQEGFSSSARPLYLLYGPPQFGKTTIANGIEEWLLTRHSNVICVYFEVREVFAADETKFWNHLGVLVDKESDCRDFDAFMNLVARCAWAGCEGKKLCLS